jgi:hypothetical protein
LLSLDLSTGGCTNVIALIVLLEQVIQKQMHEEMLNKLLEVYKEKSLTKTSKMKKDNAIIRLGFMHYRKYGKTIDWNAFFGSNLQKTE